MLTVLGEELSDPVLVSAIRHTGHSGGVRRTTVSNNGFAEAGVNGEFPPYAKIADSVPQRGDEVLVPLTVDLDTSEEVARGQVGCKEVKELRDIKSP